MALWLGAGAAALAAEGRVRAVFLGDSGSGNPDQKAVARQMRRVERGLDHVFLLGDNVYFNGGARYFRSAFHDVYARLLSRGVPFHAALGNHDVRPCPVAWETDDDQLAASRDAYRWQQEGCDVEIQLEDPAFGYKDARRYYRVDLRDSRGVLIGETYVLDSNTLISKGNEGRHDVAQLEWLRGQVDASRRRAQEDGHEPWRILTLHNPVRTPLARGFGFGRGGHGEDDLFAQTITSELFGVLARGPDAALQEELRPTIAAGRVDAVFSGHNHFYARLHPDETGVRHFVAGGGGMLVYEPLMESAPVAAGGGFHHFVSVVLTRERFEYCVIDSLGRVRDHGFWTKATAGESDRPLDRERRDEVCGR